MKPTPGTFALSGTFRSTGARTAAPAFISPIILLAISAGARAF